ncbi:MAG: hypothetical protein EBT55_01665, partial [Proteobacteria bacterium]|nr:hypothetical protein [Pseudomonadota bacterium]
DSSFRQGEAKKQEFLAVNAGFDFAMSIIIENNFDHLRLNLTGENANNFSNNYFLKIVKYFQRQLVVFLGFDDF